MRYCRRSYLASTTLRDILILKKIVYTQNMYWVNPMTVPLIQNEFWCGKHIVSGSNPYEHIIIPFLADTKSRGHAAASSRSFGGTYRDVVLNMYVLRTLYEVREIAENRIRKYNEERQHDSLDDLTPLEYLATRNLQENSNYACD